MKKLEFLLQKEGDRAWLALETPDVEILEGKYRVVARVPHPNTEIEIRVSYTSLLQVPPQRQVQSRSTRTNPEGLVVIIPYTRLKPGKWELSCLADPESKPATPWQYSVQLEVLQAESDTSEPLQPIDSTETEPASSAIDSELAAAADRATPTPEPQPSKIYQFPNPQPPQPKSTYNLQIVLDRETFVSQLGRPLIISGKIDLPQTLGKNPTPIPASQTAELTKLIGSTQLQIYLRDPQTSEILAEIDQPMLEQLPPCIFACVTYIPAECTSRLILGEAILRSGNVTLSTQVFTITGRLEQLLDAIEDNFGEQKSQPEPSPITPKQASIEPNLSFLKLVEKSLDPSPTSDETNQTLPPKLSTSQDKSVNNKLELPTFGRKLPDSNREKFLSEIANSPQAEVATKPVKLDSQTQPSERSNPLEKVEVPAIEQKPENSPQPETAASETLPAPTKEAFQTLNVQNRFWSRLSSFVSRGESPEWLKNTSLSPTPKAAENSREEIAVVENTKPTSPSLKINESKISESKPTSWEAREFVIFDEPVSQAPKNLAAKKTTVIEAEVTPMTPYVLSADDLVPMPIIEPPREIVGGKLVQVRVQLPELMPRIFVKIWVYDRQTYVILDGPRWITEFVPNGLGNVQAMAELDIPYGCMEIEFEAIAVEMQTQRESDKITVHRQVLPPSGPTLPLDD